MHARSLKVTHPDTLCFLIWWCTRGMQESNIKPSCMSPQHGHKALHTTRCPFWMQFQHLSWMHWSRWKRKSSWWSPRAAHIRAGTTRSVRSPSPPWTSTSNPTRGCSCAFLQFMVHGLFRELNATSPVRHPEQSPAEGRLRRRSNHRNCLSLTRNLLRTVVQGYVGFRVPSCQPSLLSKTGFSPFALKVEIKLKMSCGEWRTSRI